MGSTTAPVEHHEIGLLDGLVGDGRPLLSLTALGLLVSGLFAWFLAVTGQLLPHDVAWLQISESELRAVADGRLVRFMAHDRAAFGGTLVAVGTLYLWLIRFPLSEGRAWSWWLLVVSGGLGFLSFLSYLGTGYLDTWHGVATLALLPPFVFGLARSRPVPREGIRSLTVAAGDDVGQRARLGRGLLLLTGAGLVLAGSIIATIGTLVVFVPQDIDYIGLQRAALDAIDPRLVPLIAHDRAGFGGGLLVTGVLVTGCVWCAPMSRSLLEALMLAGTAGFGAAIATHGMTGYLDVTHVGPAVAAAVVFGFGVYASGSAWLARRSGPRQSPAGGLAS